MSNTNCLENMRCPNPDCDSEGPFEIRGEANFIVSDDGTGDYSDVEWWQDSSCCCMECQSSGTVKDFTVPDHG